MTHDRARELVSARLDGALPPELGPDLSSHLQGCDECRRFERRLEQIRTAVRDDSGAPDLAPAVLDALDAERRAPHWWVSAAAVFLVGAVIGAAFFGLRRPAEVAAADVPTLVLAAQREVTTLRAGLHVVERGWHPAVPERVYTGSLTYRAPEALHLALRDLTDYPGPDWTANDVTLVVDADRSWTSGLLPCATAAQPACTSAVPFVMATVNREPFSAEAPLPLDVVVPVASFTGAAEPEALGIRTEGDRRLVGVAVTGAQVDPLLGGFRAAGNLREIHPTDRVELWLDQRSLVPVRLSVFPGSDLDRALWAQRRGYVDRPGTAVLEVAWSNVDLDAPVDDAFPPAPPGAEVLDAGFEPATFGIPGVGTSDLPEGLQPHRSGVVTSGGGPRVLVGSWSDGRAWLKVRSTSDWPGGRLFGGLGPIVRLVPLGDGVGYVAEDGRRIGVHTADVDLVVSGSLAPEELLAVAADLAGVGLAVPETWAEAATGTIGQAGDAVEGLLLPVGLAGFDAPGVRIDGGVAALSYAGPGLRGFLLTQAAGSRLPPPFEPDVAAVVVRGAPGRYTPSRGTLEWVEAGVVVTLQSTSLSRAELLAVAESMRRA